MVGGADFLVGQELRDCHPPPDFIPVPELRRHVVMVIAQDIDAFTLEAFESRHLFGSTEAAPHVAKLGLRALKANLDFLDTIQPNDLMKNAVVMASYAWHAAMADTRVPRKVTR